MNSGLQHTDLLCLMDRNRVCFTRCLLNLIRDMFKKFKCYDIRYYFLYSFFAKNFKSCILISAKSYQDH